MSDSATAQLLREAIQKVAVGPDRGRDLSRDHARRLMEGVLAGEGDELQVAVLLIALRMKRESVDEFVGLFDALSNATRAIEVDLPQLCILGDPYNGYVRCLPMSPFAPAVLAACGLPVVISGVETVGPKFGLTAHQVYRQAGIVVNHAPEAAAACLSEHSWAYLDQSQACPALYQLRDLRTRMVKRTALTTLERLLMPIRATGRNQLLLGYVHRAYPQIYSALAKHAGFSELLLVKGVEGGIGPALNKPLRAQLHGAEQVPGDGDHALLRCELPGDLGADRAALELPTADKHIAQDCLERGLAVLGGEKGMARNSLVSMTALALWQFSGLDSFAQAVEKVENCLDNGSALTRFNSMREAHK